uniref:Retrovirus-related Pol polyprotein from transposon TNT 1-94 n=1 Tax=Tanacetum cinerariifolium TaxID=118510 RepID=A0A6L2KC02_TANCI|nr:hypothetical protein [Tanacetum cinerariifolium]
MSNKKRSLKRQVKVRVRFNDHVMGNLSQKRNNDCDEEINEKIRGSNRGNQNECNISYNVNKAHEKENTDRETLIEPLNNKLNFVPTAVIELGNEVVIFDEELVEIRSSRYKEVNMAARDSDDGLVCCVKNTVKDHIMDSGASFHATYCKEKLERFKLRSGKDVRYISGLKRRLIPVGQLDEEDYHVGFRDQQWKHQRLGDMSRIGMNMLASKGNVPDVQKKAMALYLLHQYEDLATMILLSKTAAGVAFGVAERLSQTFRAESMGPRGEAPKILWADSVSTTYLIYRIPYVLIGLRIPEEEWRGTDTSLAHLKVFGCDSFVKVKDVCGEAMKCTFIEHGLSLEITQSPGGSSDTSEGSKNSGSFKDSGRSDEEYSEDGVSSKEGGFDILQVRRSTRGSMAPVR